MSIGVQDPSVQLATETETVADLVELARRGLIRVPTFQRGLKWNADDVVALFDSVYRGYPIGSFLFQRRRSGAARIAIGPLVVDAPETESALWIVDGQQRITALTAGLVRDRTKALDPEDKFVVYFDAVEQRFKRPARDNAIPDTWVPVWELLDASSLSEWIHNWPQGRDAALRAVVFQAGSRIRQYRVPMYVVTTHDDELLRDIFYRINKTGKELEWDEVHDALFGGATDRPSTLRELADELESLEMGRPEETVLLTCVIAFRGLDVTRNIAEHHRRDPNALRDAVRESVPALRSTFLFLKRRCEIGHLRLLPRSIPLAVLSRFFALHPTPNERTEELLTRWVWRGLLAPPSVDERTLQRRGVACITADDEEGSVQELLGLVPRAKPAPFKVPVSFDARAAESRISLLGLCALRPTLLDGQREIDVPALIQDRDVDAFRKIIPVETGGGRSVANRILLPGQGSARRELELAWSWHNVSAATWASHAISKRAVEALTNHDNRVFFAERTQRIEESVDKLGRRLAAWSRSDRPSIPYLLRRADTP